MLSLFSQNPLPNVAAIVRTWVVNLAKFVQTNIRLVQEKLVEGAKVYTFLHFLRHCLKAMGIKLVSPIYVFQFADNKYGA